MTGQIAVEGIWRQCPLTPSVSTPNTVDVFINIQIDESSTVYFVRMLRLL